MKPIDNSLLGVLCDGLPIVGPIVVSPSKPQESPEESTSVKVVELPFQISSRLKTTLSPLSENQDILDGLHGSNEPLYVMEGSKLCAPSAMEPKPELKMNKGVKHDNAKPPMAYIPLAALQAEAEAFGFGANKYESWNYKHGLSVTRTLSAAVRHIFQFLSGEDKDVESKVHHLGCARANIAMCLDTLTNHPELDDRFKGGTK